MRSLAVMPASRCTVRPASRSMAWWAPTCARTSLRPMWVMVASNSPPVLPGAQAAMEQRDRLARLHAQHLNMARRACRQGHFQPGDQVCRAVKRGMYYKIL